MPLKEIVLGAGAPKVAIDTPQAVTVFDQADIDAAQATNPAELFDTVPGVQAIGLDRVAGISFNIRGIGELAASDESNVFVTVDGATEFHEQYRVGSFFGEPELYRRVEVLRGPASSTLYGEGALGAVIVFETKDAGDFLGEGDTGCAALRGGFGSVIWAARPGDRLDFLVALTTRRGDDHEDGGGDVVEGSEFEALSGLAKATFRIDGAGSVRSSVYDPAGPC